MTDTTWRSNCRQIQSRHTAIRRATQKTAAYQVSRKARKKLLPQQRKLIVLAASLPVASAIMGVLVITNSRKNEEAAGKPLDAF
ncbi:MAG: hypothetical protein U0105_24095 [Candidatus Obscuribacterales bacterium]